MAIVKWSNRYNIVTPLNNGDIGELGPGGTISQAGFFDIEFAPSADFVGSFKVMAKAMGVSGVTAPFLPVSYRRVNINALASDYAIVADDVIPAAIIRVPASAMSIGLLVTCTAGTCQLYSWDVQGSSAP